MLRLTVAVSLLIAAGGARGDSYNARVEGDYIASQQTTVDASGVETRTHTQALADTYRLTLSKSLYESLTFSGDGYFQDVRSWLDQGGAHSYSKTQNWAGTLRLDFGSSALGGGVTYDRRQTSSAFSQSLESVPVVTSATPTLVSETLGAVLTWRPIELPPITLRAARTDQYDLDRVIRDITGSTLSLESSFGESSDLAGSAIAGYTELDDHLHGSSTASWTGQGSVRYGGSLFGRGTFYLNDSLTAAVTDTRAQGPGAIVATQQFPIAGLALVEAIPSTPTQSTLKPLPALIDGNTSAAAGINLGTSTSSRGDVARRHLGLQFPDVLHPVNTLYLWVSQPLPPEIVSQFAWSAYQSDDNVTWTPVPLTAPVVFGPFEARFEITIPLTRARYLKVITTPLPVGATTDQRFSDIQVTELQAFQIVPAESVRGRTSAWSDNLNGAITMPITDDRQLQYDLSFTLAVQGGQQLADSWLVANGLSWNRPLSQTLTLASRVQRADSGSNTGPHTEQTTWGSTLSAQPLPTLNGSLGYNGAFTEAPEGTTLTNGVTGLVTANVYEGVAATATAGATLARTGGQTARGAQATLSTTITPAPYLSLTTSYGLSSTSTSGGTDANGNTVAPQSTISEALSAAATLTPFPALLLGGSFTRLRQSGQPSQSLGGFQISYSPFRGGNLLLALNHNESFESLTGSTSRTSGASATWRPTRWANLMATYSLASTSAPLGSTDAQTFLARLILTP